MTTEQPDKLYFMPQDLDDEAGIEIGDGRVIQLHPYDDIDAEFLRTIVHRYNNFEKALAALKRDHELCVALCEKLDAEHPARYAMLALIEELEEVA